MDENASHASAGEGRRMKWIWRVLIAVAALLLLAAGTLFALKRKS